MRKVVPTTGTLEYINYTPSKKILNKVRKNVEKFEKADTKKYIAVMKDGKRIGFGDPDSEQYKDNVPKDMGGGKWTKKDHGDDGRRDNYRARHGGIVLKDGTKAIDVEFSPAWFSYYLLW